jgi:hypothetical protein
VPAIDHKDFPDKLAAFIAQRAGISYTGSPRQLWLGKAIEEEAAKPFAVLAQYPGGALPHVPLSSLAFQVRVTGKDGDVEQLITKLYNALLDADARPLRKTDFNGYRILAVKPRAPGQIGRRPDGAAEWVFNFDVEAIAL